MAEYGGEQYKKQEGHQTDEHVQNQLHSTTAGHGCKEGKQGVVEKIKEKLPGGDHGSEQHTTPASTATVGGAGGYNVGEEGHEKKGLMDKIKDKLPGGDHGSEEHRTHDTATVGGGEHGNVGEEEEHEKLMDQIKDTVARTG